MWRERLLAAAVQILDALIEVYPEELDREELGERTGLTASGRTFGAAFWLLRRYALAEPSGRGLRARSSWSGGGMTVEVVPTQEPVLTARADLVAILEELHDVLVRIDDQSVDRRYVDFGALAKRLKECIEKVQELPDKRA